MSFKWPAWLGRRPTSYAAPILTSVSVGLAAVFRGLCRSEIRQHFQGAVTAGTIDSRRRRSAEAGRANYASTRTCEAAGRAGGIDRGQKTTTTTGATSAAIARARNRTPNQIGTGSAHCRMVYVAVHGYVPLYGFGVDVTLGARLHTHGAIAANDDELQVVHGTLCHAGGRWANPRHSDKQCQFKPLRPADDWAAYCLRHQAKVKRLIKSGTTSITSPLRSRAKELWSASRSS